MSFIRRAFIVAFALLAGACSAKAAGPPEIVVDREVCSHCGMLISEPVYAAAYQVSGQPPRLFDDIGCMLDAIRKETGSLLFVWLQDANGRGWLDAKTAIVIATSHVPTPMNGGLLAYSDTTAAAKAAASHRGVVVGSLPQLMTWKAGAR